MKKNVLDCMAMISLVTILLAWFYPIIKETHTKKTQLWELPSTQQTPSVLRENKTSNFFIT